MSIHNMFSWRTKKNIHTFGLKKASYQELCSFSYISSTINNNTHILIMMRWLWKALYKWSTWTLPLTGFKFQTSWSNSDLVTSPIYLHRLIMNSLSMSTLWIANFLQIVWFGFNITFNNLSDISWRCLDVVGGSMLTFRVLPHWNITPQTLKHDIPPSHYTDTELTSSALFLMLSAQQKSS